MRTLFALLSVCLLAGCGALPQPFFGDPGVMGARLAEPPPSRLAVPTPGASLLPDPQAKLWAGATAKALVDQEVPATAVQRLNSPEWTLVLSAEVQGANVVPSYAVQNPAGQSQGVAQGAPVPAKDWAGGDPKTLEAAARQAAPGIVSLLNRIEAARQQSDPNSLRNRPARVYLARVTGAPGDGNRSLMTQMRLKLQEKGIVVQDTPKGADYMAQGDVATAPGSNGQIRVELQWIITDGRGERGRIVQINEVPPNTLSPYWGDVAVAAATEAAGGVRDVIANATGAPRNQ